LRFAEKRVEELHKTLNRDICAKVAAESAPSNRLQTLSIKRIVTIFPVERKRCFKRRRHFNGKF